MADRYLKHIPSGQIFIYAPPFNTHEDFVEVADAQGTPMPDPEAAVNPGPRRKKRDTAEPVQEEPTPVELADAALSADASRGL